MSYDIYLVDPTAEETLELDQAHQLQGGTYAMGGTTEAWLNITYNYAPHYYRTMGEKGIRTIYGMTGADSIRLLETAAAQLKEDVASDYWEPTEGNARRALLDLIALAKLRPGGVWKGD